MTATLLIYGFILFGTLMGAMSGFDVQVKKLGSGAKSMLITGVIVVVFGSAIKSSPIVENIFESLQNSMADSFLGQGIAFVALSYVVMFLGVLLVLKVCTATIASFTVVRDGQSDWLNKIMGGALACTMCVAFVMIIVLIMSIIPGASSTMQDLKQGAAGVFYYNNLFMSLLGWI